MSLRASGKYTCSLLDDDDDDDDDDDIVISLLHNVPTLCQVSSLAMVERLCLWTDTHVFLFGHN